jgi:flagellar hook protein FlgE
MGSALWIAISGLNASSKQMDVIGNNIANSNTMGFKAGKAYFANVLSQSLSGGASGVMQIGQGVTVADVATQFSQGSLESTSSGLDLAIDGGGFFCVEDTDGSSYYTRAGAFHIDGDGYLVDINNYRVQGYAPGSPTLGDVSTRGAQSEPAATTSFSVGLNLDARTAAGNTFYSSQTVYDTLGGAHTLAGTYQKTEGAGYWGFQTALDGIDTAAQGYSGLKFDGYGNLEKVYSSTAAIATQTVGTSVLTVNKPGQLYMDTTTGTPISFTTIDGVSWTLASNGGYTNLSWQGNGTQITLDLDGSGGTDITLTEGTGVTWGAGTLSFAINQTEVDMANITVTAPSGALTNGATIGASNVLTWDLTSNTAEAITGYASTSTVKALRSDGYPSGVIRSLSIEKDGTITGFFTNGQTSSLGQIALADFSNPWGLKKMGSNLFSSTLTSGQAIVNAPGSAGLGEVTSNSIEMANTDLGTEFINMITAQRAYQASAKVITTADAMMAELMNIKR